MYMVFNYKYSQYVSLGYSYDEVGDNRSFPRCDGYDRVADTSVGAAVSTLHRNHNIHRMLRVYRVHNHMDRHDTRYH